MGLVSQEPILFATSIRGNILFGKEDATSEEIEEAAKEPMHMTSSHNYQTAMTHCLKNIWITPTALPLGRSSGDVMEYHMFTQGQFEGTRSQGRIEGKGGSDSSISRKNNNNHRSSFVYASDADLIVVIQSGEVTETGSHDQLIGNTGGSYSAMVKLQKTLVVNEKPSSLSQETDSKTLVSPDIDNATLAMEKEGLIETSFGLKEDSHPSWRYLIQMNAPEWNSALMGCIGALLNGLIQPMLAFFQGAMLSMFFLSDHDEIRSQTRTLCYAFVGIAASAFIFSVIQHYYFGIMGENLTKRVREAIFAKIMTFETEWFDQENNTTGALCSRLATDTVMVRNLVADRLAFFAQAISASVSAVILSMILSWKLALVAVSLQLVIIVSFYMKTLITTNPHNKSSEIASEAVNNHRIITAYHSQEQVMRLFAETQKGPKMENNKQHWFAGMGLFARPFLTNINIAILYCRYDNCRNREHDWDLTLGKNALKSLFMILKRKSQMGILKQDEVSPEKIDGHIQLKEVDFFYQTRPTKMALNGLSLKIDAGEVVALVGTSGSGKSTIIGLIQRFYDPSKGSVEVDGVDISCYDLKALRSCIAWVSQEPTLFAETIKENIAYGKEKATEAEIIQAATLANIHEFISSMKDGYDTYCGERGVQLSGGQKQRIAIARAILKNPAILLLDEATSALDLKSEALVQDALENTMVGRTCVIVAHRLSTIQRSNRISVIDNGRVIEEGSHDDLLAKGEEGAYFSLFSLQQQASISRG
ncbi:hypothetical protein OSB04_005037 [Centaurea solstitialis]|uniref:ABC transporter B family member 15-like n=1 Tax=Centaurea solstitialis TaxID=347529 RepID=A0AA38WGE7_9ASTR|nr:hypothetical protein OSB04_005037 [Centaurea solstitialis]